MSSEEEKAKRAAYMRVYNAANKDKINSQRRENHRNNPEKKRAEKRAWIKANPGKKAIYDARYRASPDYAEKKRILSRNYYAKEPEKHRIRSKKYKDSHPYTPDQLANRRKNYRINIDKILKARHIYVANNLPKLAEYQRKRRKKHPEKVRALEALRRALKLNATPPWLTNVHKDEIQQIYKQAALDDGHVDHIVPLQGKIVCGLHVPWNLQVLPKSENLKKYNKFDESLGIALGRAA